MADEFNVPEGGDGQDVCSFFASLINQRQSVERLLNWLRESQTTCTDSNCFDDINGLPGSEIGSPLDNFGSGHQDSDTDAFTLVLWFVVGVLTLYAMALARNRDPAQTTKKSRPANAINDDHSGFRRDQNGDDDQSSPAV